MPLMPIYSAPPMPLMFGVDDICHPLNGLGAVPRHGRVYHTPPPPRPAVQMRAPQRVSRPMQPQVSKLISTTDVAVADNTGSDNAADVADAAMSPADAMAAQVHSDIASGYVQAPLTWKEKMQAAHDKAYGVSGLMGLPARTYTGSPYMTPFVANQDQILIDSQLGVDDPVFDGYGMGLDGLRGDPFGITDLTGGILSFIGQQKQADLQKKAIAEKLQEARMAQSEAAHTFALDQAQAVVDSAARQRNTTTYALFAIGGVAAIVSVAFLLSAMKGKSK